MKKTSTVLVPGLMFLSLLAGFTPLAYANHESSLFVTSGFTANENWLDLIFPCLQGVTELSYPENTLFFVSSGWGFNPWTEAPPAERSGFMSEATRFDLLIDGQPQSQSRVYEYFKDGVEDSPPDLMTKLFNSEYHSGLTGSHLFTGQLYLDASLIGGTPREPALIIECNTTVNFT